MTTVVFNKKINQSLKLINFWVNIYLISKCYPELIILKNIFFHNDS